MITTIIDYILDTLYEFVSIVFSLLPESPIQKLEVASELSTFVNVLSYINYFVPINWFVGILSLYVGAVLIWYGIRWIMRLAQYIQ